MQLERIGSLQQIQNHRDVHMEDTQLGVVRDHGADFVHIPALALALGGMRLQPVGALPRQGLNVERGLGHRR